MYNCIKYTFISFAYKQIIQTVAIFYCFLLEVSRADDQKECGYAPTPFDVMRDPFYAPDLEEIIEKEFNVRTKISGLSRESIRSMYRDLMRRAVDNEDINQIMEDMKETWKKELHDWQMRGCMAESMSRDEL